MGKTSDRLDVSTRGTVSRIAESSLVALKIACLSISIYIHCGAVRTLRQIFDDDAIELLNLLHEEFSLVYLDNECCAAFISTCKAKFAKGVFDRLGDVYGV